MLVCGLAAPAPAEAVTLRDLVDLSKQGLGDDLLIALVEAEKSVFHLSAADVKSLKEQGLSDRLLIHLLQTPSLRPEPESRLLIADVPARRAAHEPAPVVIIERVDTIAVPVAVPVYVPVPAQRAHRRGADRERVRDDERDRDRGRDGNEARRPSKPASTEYWGYGGKLRPDAWGQPKTQPKKK
ncbi:MAG TPA: hypothetical protein VMN81_00720 [Vicinamibacterales bacterium]|nr:hypothetical protein [Vicinamibacterales bacterium]